MITQKEIDAWIDDLHGGLFEVSNPYLVRAFNDKFAVLQRKYEGKYIAAERKVVGKHIVTMVVEVLKVDKEGMPIILETFTGMLTYKQYEKIFKPYDLHSNVHEVGYSNLI